jgi:hypothetical protein
LLEKPLENWTRRCRPNTSNPCRWKKPIWKRPAGSRGPTELTGAATISAETYFFPVVILGGGFAGPYCARALSAGLRQAAADAVALVADQNVMLFHPMLAEVSGSSISPLHVVNPLRRPGSLPAAGSAHIQTGGGVVQGPSFAAGGRFS